MSFIIFLPLVVIGGLATAFLVVGFIKLFSGEGHSRRPDGDADEITVLREIQQGLDRMEKRVEALETILLDREIPARRSETR
ncbi:phage shock protein B [bacterium]|nr:hypothetical protein [Candidatus Omnitrophota bacterium]MCK6494821.1 phage shock protein B [bacterium]